MDFSGGIDCDWSYSSGGVMAKVSLYKALHIPGFNPPVPNLKDKEIRRRLDAINLLQAAENYIIGFEPKGAVNKIREAIDKLRA